MIPWFEWRTISFGPITIQVWGLFVALGIWLSISILLRRSANRLRITKDTILDLCLWSIFGGFIGARLLHVFGYNFSYYSAHVWEILFVWRGGLSSFGGFIGALSGGLLFLYKKKILVSKILLLDEMLYAAVYGWMLGRVGCALIHDHWGVPCNCSFAIQTNSGGRFDMAVLEIIALAPLALVLFFTRARAWRPGVRSAIVLIYYGILRFALDFFRAYDIVNADTRFWHLTPAQYCAILLCFCGIGLFFSHKNTTTF